MMEFFDEFIDFVAETMPSVSPYTVEGLKECISQFKFEYKKNCTTTMENEFSFLTQGDIIDRIPFYRMNTNTGEIETSILQGLVITNTCDCDRDENILIAPIVPIDKLTKKNKDTINDIKHNKVYGYMYIPDAPFENYVIDFSLINNYNRNFILKMIESGKINKIRSLNIYGFYLFICKITIYLCRPEDKGVNEKRKEELLEKI